MYYKKIKRKCGVRGCRNTDSYSISKTREIGNSVIICKDCLAEALSEIDNGTNDCTKIKRESIIKSLFFNSVALGENDKITIPAENSDNKDSGNIEEFICDKCNRSFKSEKGLNMHLKNCKGETENEE